jgi:hypothetical protein
MTYDKKFVGCKGGHIVESEKAFEKILCWEYLHLDSEYQAGWPLLVMEMFEG